MLSEQVRSVLADQSSFDRLRALIDAGEEWDQPLWQQFAELGLLAASIPEDYGGLGLSDLDLGVISAELGRANAALPFFSTISLAANAIMHAGSDQQQEKWLPKFAEGEAIACVALGDAAQGWLPSNPSVSFQNRKLRGETWPIFDAGIANLIVVRCQSEQGPMLALAELDQPEITRNKLEGFDQLRAAYRIEFNGAEAELLGANDRVSGIADKAAIQLAFEAVGAAEVCIHMAKDYAMDRKIFGRQLASYQAIKHKLADILVQAELARSSAYYAGWAARGAPDELPVAAAASYLTASKAFQEAARENVQVHGGIGYTFEANCHFFYRRERLNAALLGPRKYWADRLMSNVAPQPSEEN